MIKLLIFILLFLFHLNCLAQNICYECRARMGTTPVDALSDNVGQITNRISCQNGSSVRLFDGVDNSRCNHFSATTYNMGGSPTRFDEYLTYDGVRTNFTLGFSTVSDRIQQANRETPPNMFNGYVSYNYGGCARTQLALRQVRRNYCFVFAKEVDAKVTSVLNQLLGGSDISTTASCLANAGSNFSALKSCYFSIYNKNEIWLVAVMDEFIRLRQQFSRTPLTATDLASLRSQFQEQFRQFILSWGRDLHNQLGALTRAKQLARTAALYENGSSAMGGCENIIGELYRAWPDLFNFSTGDGQNKSTDYAYCTSLQNPIDSARERAQEQVSMNLITGIGIAAAVAAAPLTGGSSLAVAAGIISGTAGAVTGVMGMTEGVRREGLIPLQMSTREINVFVNGNTPEANRQLQADYRTLRRDVQILYGMGILNIAIGVWSAGGGGSQLAEAIATRYAGYTANPATIQTATRLFRNLGESPVFKEVMIDLFINAGLSFQGPNYLKEALLQN